MHDWNIAPESEWRAFVADHMEIMATNQHNLANKIDCLIGDTHDRDVEIESRMTKVEQRSGFYALVVSGVVGLIANLRALTQ